MLLTLYTRILLSTLCSHTIQSLVVFTGLLVKRNDTYFLCAIRVPHTLRTCWMSFGVQADV